MKKMFIAIFCSVALLMSVGINTGFCEQEQLTITTYYPSPYGVYRVMRLHPGARPTQADEGDMYYDDGLPAQGQTYSKGLYIYEGVQSGWVKVSSGGPKWIGGVFMTEGTSATLIGKGYGLPPFAIKPGSDNSLVIVDYTKFRLNLQGGTYKIIYGGGFFRFSQGSKVMVRLANGLSAPEEYELNNTMAYDDATGANFWKGEPVGIPLKELNFSISTDRPIYIWMIFSSIANSGLDWEQQIGPSCGIILGGTTYAEMKDCWTNMGSPVFNRTTGWECNPGMGSELCGPSLTYPPDNEAERVSEFNQFTKSYRNMYNVNLYGGGTYSGVSVDIYKTD